MITIKEIAQLAGTSRGTVDRVLNGRGKVSPLMQERVLQIAREYGYRSNPYAKALVNGKKKYRIGVVINSKGNEFFDDVLLGMRDAASQNRAYGVELVIREIKGWDEREQLEALDDILLEEQLDALAITPMDTPAVYSRLCTLAQMPIVTLNTDIHKLDGKLAFIGCDYLNSGQLCGDIAVLALPGGGKTCIVTGSFHSLGHNQRIEGFQEAIAANPLIHVVDVRENNDDNDLSYQVTGKLIAEYEPDLIYFCAAGIKGGMQAVKEAEKKIKVVAVDDLAAMQAYLRAGDMLALVTQQPYKQGAMMVDILYNYLVLSLRPGHVHNYMENQVHLRHSI